MLRHKVVKKRKAKWDYQGIWNQEKLVKNLNNNETTLLKSITVYKLGKAVSRVYGIAPWTYENCVFYNSELGPNNFFK